MRSIAHASLSFLLLSLSLSSSVACTTAAPRDLSNASDLYVRPLVSGNTHAVREVEPTPFAAAVLAQSDREPADRARDARKQAADLLTFVGVRPGMRVAELGCGTGYFTELLARAVGPNGAVAAQNSSAAMSESARDAWMTRLGRPAMKHVAFYDRPYASPLPPEVRDLDLVYLGAHYGLLTALGADREGMNASVRLALARGGRYVVMDWALPDWQENPTKEHREESRSTRREIEAAGFVFVKEGRFLRTSPYPDDWDGAALGPGDSPAPPRARKADVFVLVFVKP